MNNIHLNIAVERYHALTNKKFDEGLSPEEFLERLDLKEKLEAQWDGMSYAFQRKYEKELSEGKHEPI